jgi:hypothetical protein
VPKTLRLGTGAGFSSDRLDPALDLVKRGELDFIVFECVGERTLAFGHRDRLADAERGYNPLLERRLRAIAPDCHRNGTRIITNMGVANPLAAGRAAISVARELGLDGFKVAVVTGDDVTHLLGPDVALIEGMNIAEVGRPFLGANAYLGIDAILPALATGADLIITGRVADPSMFLAPQVAHFGWATDDWDRMGAGTVVGHLMECAAQITGGYFCDPGFKDVKDLAYVGFPIAEIASDGSAVITKLPDTGGLVDLRTVKEQLLYEVHDPTAYLTPDVTADFTTVALNSVGPDRVSIGSTRAGARPDQLKVTVAFDGGLLAEAGISYAGPGAQARASLAASVVEERMRHVHGSNSPLRTDLIGAASLHGTTIRYAEQSEDVRLRCALRASSREQAESLLWEVESLLCCGPAGGGGYRGAITPSVMTYSALIDRDKVTYDVEVMTA